MPRTAETVPVSGSPQGMLFYIGFIALTKRRLDYKAFPS